MYNKHSFLTPLQVDIMKTARRRKQVNCNQFDWWALMDLVNKNILDKVLAEEGRGWPYFKLSHRGHKRLKSIQRYEQEKRHANSIT